MKSIFTYTTKRFLFFALSMLATGLGFAQSLTTDLVFYLPIIGNANDYSANGLHGVSNGTLVADRNGVANSAYEFSGVGQTIVLPISPLIQPELPLSVSMYVYFDQLGATAFANDFTPSYYTGMWFGSVANGQLHLNIGDGGPTSPSFRRSKTSNGAVTQGMWHHIVGVIRDYNDMDIYIDCVDAGGIYSGYGDTVMYYAGNPGQIGATAATSAPSGAIYMQGKVDEIAFWSRALNPGDIERICSGELNNLLATGITSDEIKTEDFQISPNPTQGTLRIALSGSLANCKSITILDLHGKTVTTLGSDRLGGMDADLSALSAGLYFLQALDEGGKQITKKIVKQ